MSASYIVTMVDVLSDAGFAVMTMLLLDNKIYLMNLRNSFQKVEAVVICV